MVNETFRDKEYAAISGIPDFCRASAKLAYGDSCSMERLAVCQSISGTGALRIGAEFLARFYRRETGSQSDRVVYLPDPTWGNHASIFRDSGLKTAPYRYFDKKTNGLDISGLLEDFAAMPEGSIVVLHACAHNPTGVDPTADQWSDILRVVRQKRHQVFFDLAYQGFASGLPDRDAFAVRLFAQAGLGVLVAQSYAKNFGLYGERVGAISVVCTSPREKEAVESQLKIVVRPMYSNPPIHGARIVATILDSPSLHSEW
jgi:aspartate aminotransferase